jgi:hypothetical protein
MTAVKRATTEELRGVIHAAMEAVKFGVLNIQIEDVAEKAPLISG